jgi:hypothetical protein
MIVRSESCLWFGLVALAAGTFGCGSSSNGSPSDAGASTGLCPDDVPDLGADGSCPVALPSYQVDVAPILQRDCIPCHGPSGAAGYDETSYSQVYDQRGAILSQVSACLMPSVGSPQLTIPERLALLDWLVCGAPDN